MKHELDLSSPVRQLIEAHFPGLRKTVRRNLTRLTGAFLRLAVSVRFGYGGLHLTSIARVLPDGATFKSNYKWLSRFLKNRYFDPASLAECMLVLLVGRRAPSWTLVLFDQTTINGVQVVNAAIPFPGRAVPVAWVDFEYPWTTLRPASQNLAERYLLAWVAEAAPSGARLLFVLDRGYARVELIQELNRWRQPYLIRGRADGIVEATVRGRRQRLRLGRLPHRTAVAMRYRQVLYQGQQQEPVDGIVYRGPGFRDAWFLIVPPDSEAWLPTGEVVRLYAQRMQIEHCFRDWKSHLGLRGLRLEVERAPRLLRLLMAFTLAYLLTLLLGQDPLAEKARAYFEQPRGRPRHGTRRVLSVLSLALYLLADARWRLHALARFEQIVTQLMKGRGVALPPAFSP